MRLFPKLICMILDFKIVALFFTETEKVSSLHEIAEEQRLPFRKKQTIVLQNKCPLVVKFKQAISHPLQVVLNMRLI